MEDVNARQQLSVKDPNFDADESTLENLWGDLLKSVPHDSITNQMLAMEAYEQAFGIQTTGASSPITLVTMKDSTNYLKDSMLERTIDRIIQLKLHKLTGLNLNELLNLPTYELKMIFQSATKVGRSDKKKLDALDDILE